MLLVKQNYSACFFRLTMRDDSGQKDVSVYFCSYMCVHCAYVCNALPLLKGTPNIVFSCCSIKLWDVKIENMCLVSGVSEGKNTKVISCLGQDSVNRMNANIVESAPCQVYGGNDVPRSILRHFNSSAPFLLLNRKQHRRCNLLLTRKPGALCCNGLSKNRTETTRCLLSQNSHSCSIFSNDFATFLWSVLGVLDVPFLGRTENIALGAPYQETL